MTIFKIWLLTLVLAMPDGRYVVARKAYPDQATCMAAGRMSELRYAEVNLQAGYSCQEIESENATQ